ncbi:hypothetical protein B0H14DRAFT_2616104 [Mycena olivaceomarginata]|nr:hypothetical protein B0H14DRAFT_2616104 [Mycena olivaceomarginata]
MSIKPIDKTSIHRITSGQVVIDLQTAVKELSYEIAVGKKIIDAAKEVGVKFIVFSRQKGNTTLKSPFMMTEEDLFGGTDKEVIEEYLKASKFRHRQCFASSWEIHGEPLDHSIHGTTVARDEME